MKTPGKNDIFDSFEELLFREWLNDAKRVGIVEKYEFHPYLFSITPSCEVTTCSGKKKRLRSFNYSPDCVIYPGKKFECLDLNWIQSDRIFFIDIKGAWKSQSEQRVFSITQKVLFEKYKVYVNPVYVEDRKYRSQGKIKNTPGLFSSTWAPRRALLTEKMNPSKRFIACRTIEDFLIRKP